ncbi:hypothetical protein CL176_00885 [Suicoccus acidiformans]|uniref:LysM domain-containing protein n=1 Tax=Suicoccus acidiformans TaxID=2036206 RepID=A0A347WHZ0_9LACT|nr:LysM peptidoglycan-binding domain-containing protein [Suicoccus acidiformans]AXY24697.1 hypothetical protein CL176_00885 [Suicoccus acidiformans]
MTFKYRKIALSLLTSLTLLGATGSVSAQTVHTVQPGEYLLSIANAYGVSVEELMAWNGLSSDYLDVGMNLYIYEGSSGAGYSDDSYLSYETPAVGGYHTVQAGETLSTIAQAYGLSVDQLAAYNNIASSWIYVGEQLAIPSGYAYTSPSYDYSGSYYTGPVSNWSNYHSVSSGETLSTIAQAYGTTVDALMATNGLSSTWLNVGDALLVPNGPVNVPSYEPSYTAEAQISGGTVHTVQPGDTLYDLAVAYGSTVADIMSWNGLSSDYLTVGTDLIVSPNGPVSTTEEATVAETNNGERIRVDLSKLPERARPRTHTVALGENIWRIADQYGISAESLRIWNDLDDDTLMVGQELYVSNPAFVPTIHTVEAGEDIAAIASKYNTTSKLIETWNDLTSAQAEAIEAGDQLIVSDPEPEFHEVKPGETLRQIAEEYNISEDDLRQWNKIPAQSEIVNGTLIVSNPTGVERGAGEPSESDSSGASSEEAEASVDETSADSSPQS